MKTYGRLQFTIRFGVAPLGGQSSECPEAPEVEAVKPERFRRTPDLGMESCVFNRIPLPCVAVMILVAITALLAGCSKPDQPAAAAPASEKAAEPESRIKHGKNGETIITLDEAIQKVMGLQVSPLSGAQVSQEVKGYGHVLDVSLLSGLVADLTTAQAASDASQAEFKRLKTLAAQNNASDRALQTAEAAAVRDQAQVESTRLKVLANWGGAIATRENLPAFIHSLSSLTSALVELDLPAGDSVDATPTGAQLLSLANTAKPIPAQFLGPAPMVDAQLQGRGFLFLVDPNPSLLAPGAAISGFLTLRGEALSGVSVPREAIINRLVRP